jgi:hypothetical protein
MRKNRDFNGKLTMLTLEKSSLIGKGRHRECYIHPEDPGKCVKIVVFGDMKETARELAFYKLLEKRKASMAMISRYFGVAETNMGDGHVFELVRDSDGGVSKTLDYYLTSCMSDTTNAAVGLDDLLSSIDALKQYMLKEKIITMTIKAKNIAYKRNKSSEHLVLVDGIGNSDFFPVCNWIGPLAIRKIKRRWKRFEEFLPFQLSTGERRS